MLACLLRGEVALRQFNRHPNSAGVTRADCEASRDMLQGHHAQPVELPWPPRNDEPGGHDHRWRSVECACRFSRHSGSPLAVQLHQFIDRRMKCEVIWVHAVSRLGQLEKGERPCNSCD